MIKIIPRAKIITRSFIIRSHKSTLNAAFEVRVENKNISDPSANVPLRQVNGEISAVSAAEYRKKHEIFLSGSNMKEYSPVLQFKEAPFPDSIKRVLLEEGYESPTPIQSQSWPILADKRDLISVARTGSGKTVAFLLPAIQRIIASKQSARKERDTERRFQVRPPQVLVLAPTRELAAQIHEVVEKYRSCGVDSAVCYGGASKFSQSKELNNGVDIVIATPGRCIDLMESGSLNINSVSYLVFDEADRMLDMGFERQIREIVRELPHERQTVFFTATWPSEVQQLAGQFMKAPIKIKIGDENELTANKAITQNILVVKQFEKKEKLFDLLEDKICKGMDTKKCPRTLIFLSRKMDCDGLLHDLIREGFRADSIHGDRNQEYRIRAIENFKNGTVSILVATDVASRGLDVKGIEHVINFDFPNTVEDYVHRIGRTARGSNTGTAHTFFTKQNAAQTRGLIELLQRCGQTVPNELKSISSESYGSSGPPRSFTPQRRPPTDYFAPKTSRDSDRYGNSSRGSGSSGGYYDKPSRGSGGSGGSGYFDKPSRGGYEEGRANRRTSSFDEDDQEDDFESSSFAKRKSGSSGSSNPWDSKSRNDFKF